MVETHRPTHISLAIRDPERADGRLLRRGEFASGFPCARIHNPDGYEIEVWYA